MGAFGTSVSPAHFVEIPDPADPSQPKRPDASTVTLTARNHATFGAVPGVITVGAYGYWGADIPGVDLIDVSADGGATWVGPLESGKSIEDAANVGAAVAQAQQAATNAGSAAASANAAAQAAATAAGSALPKSGAGQPGGTATLDTTGRLPVGQAPLIILERLDTLEGGGGGGSASGGNQMLRWRFARADSTLVAGYAGNDSEVCWPVTASRGPRVRTDAAGATGLSVDIEVNTGAGFASIYGATKPTLVAGASDLRSAASLAPSVQGIPSGALVRCVVKTVPAEPGGTGAVTFQGADSEKAYPDATDPTPLAPSSHAMTLPTGGAAGDVVVRSIATASGAADASMPSPWVLKNTETVVSGLGAGTFRVTHFAAPWSAGLSMTVTTTQGTPSASWARVVRGTDVGLLDVFSSGPTVGYQAGGSFATPAFTATNNYEVLIETLAAFQPSTMTGAWTIALTGGSAGFTKESDKRSARDAGSNVSLAAFTRTTGLSAGATAAAATATITGGTGSASNVSWVATLIGARAATTSPGPSELFVELPLFGG